MSFKKLYPFFILVPTAVGCQTSESSHSTSKDPVRVFYANTHVGHNQSTATLDASVGALSQNVAVPLPKNDISARFSEPLNSKSVSSEKGKEEKIDNRYSVVTFADDDSDPTVDDFENNEGLSSMDESLLSDSPNDFALDPGSDKGNPIICQENLFYASWAAQFDRDWLSKNAKKYKKVSARHRALVQARTDEFIRLVYPALEKTDYDFPVVINQPVLSWIAYFTGVGRKHFVVWLEKGKTLIPQMKTILEQNGMPTDLVYLSMIESGYSSKSLSNVGAVGLWQFMPGTAVEYGLKINDWVDERRDVEKSTQAASLYLKDLYAQFGSWHLAAAGYNGGPGLVSKTLRHYGEDASFFELTSKKRMNSQTANYVPKILAALIVAKNASLFGFDTPDNNAPKLTRTIPVDRSISLADLAQSIQVDKSVLEDLNPQLRLGVTPPAKFTSSGHTNVIVPVSKAEMALASLNSLPEAPNNHMVAARIKHMEKLSAFAKRYQISMASLLKSNSHLKSSSSLRKGQVVYVSVVLGSGQYDKLTAVKNPHHKHKHIAHHGKHKHIVLKSKKAKNTRVALSKD